MQVIRLISVDGITCLEVDGQSLGSGIKEVRFEQLEGEMPTLEVKVDVGMYRKMEPGFFDKFERTFMEGMESPRPDD